MSTRGVGLEIAAVYALAALVTLVVSHTPGLFISSYGHLILAASFLWLSLRMARREPNGAARYGIDLAGMLEAGPDEPESFAHGLWFAIRRALPSVARELAVAAALAAIVFPPFVIGFRIWHQVGHPFTFHPPADPLDFVLTHLVAVALPEEALFRGYFQTRLDDLWGASERPLLRRVRLLGAEFSPAALACQAALFALLHFLVGFSPARFAVFAPGLLFGWLRARRGGIGAAVWFHAMCNLLAEVLTRGYL